MNEATKPDSFYNTQLPSISTGGEPTDIAKGDTLLNIISKIQRYINYLKYATGIKISDKYSPVKSKGQPNNNDTVETAIEKLHRMFSEIKLSLPADFTPSNKPNQNLEPGDDFIAAFAKIEADRIQPNSIETEKKKCFLRIYRMNQVRVQLL